jgi:FMN-dependent NADH-azoreductase
MIPSMKGVLRFSDELATELLACDALLIASPMHNFNISASLKASIDQVVRTDMTFKITEEGPVPLVRGKKALIVTSRGGFVAGTAYDFQEPYLKTILGFIGITDITFVYAEGVNSSDKDREEAINLASEKLVRLADTW